MATSLTSIGSALYDSGTTDPSELAAAIAKKGGVSLLQAIAAAAGVIAAKTKKAVSGVADTVTAPLDSLGDIAGVIKDAADTPARIVKFWTDRGTWVRGIYIFVGLAMITIGAVKLAGNDLAPAVQTAIKAVK